MGRGFKSPIEGTPATALNPGRRFFQGRVFPSIKYQTISKGWGFSMSVSKRGGHRPGAGRKPNPATIEKAEIAPTKRGGARPGAGRKWKPRRIISNVELLSYVHKAISPSDLGALFDQAAAGDFPSMRKLHELYSRAVQLAQGALASPVCADLFAPTTHRPDSGDDQ
jgi:hypothetical protein